MVDCCPPSRVLVVLLFVTVTFHPTASQVSSVCWNPPSAVSYGLPDRPTYYSTRTQGGSHQKNTRTTARDFLTNTSNVPSKPMCDVVCGLHYCKPPARRPGMGEQKRGARSPRVLLRTSSSTCTNAERLLLPGRNFSHSRASGFADAGRENRVLHT